MWTIPSIPTGAHDIDIHRPESASRPSNDPNRRSDARRGKRQRSHRDEDDFEIDTFESHSDAAATE